MTINPLGPLAALTAFFSIWFGHVAVRKIEFISSAIWLPISGFAIAGLAFEWISLLASNLLLSTACGILGITLLFDAFEFTRQQRRIIHGHTPANPHNPRHAAILADSNSRATTLDLLKREPTDQRVTGH
ncbi:MAG TPA: DUF4491 family protein [Anaerolineales bacterium]|nr:DUF4491 family protein [Anaerolineales bacterium]